MRAPSNVMGTVVAFRRTCGSGGPRLYASEALAELVLGAVELGEGRRQVFELLVELLLDLGELLSIEALEIDCETDRSVSKLCTE